MESVTSPHMNVTSLPSNNASAHGRDERLARVEIAIQGVIFALALIGNLCVLYGLTYRKKKTSRMHVFIMHLSIADLMVAFFNILPQLIWDVTYRFQGNDFLCRTVKYMQVVVMYLSTYILMMTAIDRYRAICHPLSNHSGSRKRVKVMIGIAWTLSLTLSTPQLVIFRLQEVEAGSGVYDCWAYFGPEWTVKLYITCFTVSIYIVPFYVLAVLYGRICWEVWKNVRHIKDGKADHFIEGKVVYKFNGTGTISIISPHLATTRKLKNGGCKFKETLCPRVHSMRSFSRSKIKTIKLTFVVIIAYVVCWSPFFITQMWWAFDEDAPYTSSTFVICLLLGSLNSCCNPWIYMAFSGSLIQQLLPCRKKSKRPKYREKAREAPKPKSNSDSKSSSLPKCPCQERILCELNKNANMNHNNINHHHNCHNQLAQNNVNNVVNRNRRDSPSSSTKITGTGSLSVSRKTRCQVFRLNGFMNYRYDSSNNCEPLYKDDLHIGFAGTKGRPACQCNCIPLNELTEGRQNERENRAEYYRLDDGGCQVLYDLSSARRYRKYLSQPSLTYEAQCPSNERLNSRCTTSV